MDRLFEAGYDVVARGRGWMDALISQDLAMNGLQELGLEAAEGLRLEILRQNADEELLAFKDKADVGVYHTYAEVKAEIDGYIQAHSEIIRYESVGTSIEGRPIHAVQITGPGDYQGRPAQLVTGLHHAREWISVEVPMAFIKMLVEGYGSDAEITELVNERNIWVIPVVNPDGLNYSQTEYKMWRKNRRRNPGGSYGVDPNRNYGYQWGTGGASPSPDSDTYRGPAAFSEPEIQAVRDLGIREGFVSAISFHSYSELVLWPWGYTYDPAPDEDALALHGTKMAAFVGYKPQQSSDLYPTSGDFDDWFYGDQGTLAYTFELGRQFVPPESQIPGIVSGNLKALRYFLANCADPFPLVTHRGLESTTNTAGPYPVRLALSRRYQAADPIAKAEMVYHLPGTEGWVRTPLVKGSGEAYHGSLPGTAGYGEVAYHFEITMKPSSAEGDPEVRRLPETGEYSFQVVEQLYLLVDDDNGKSMEAPYLKALEALQVPFSMRASKDLKLEDLLGASAVIWTCGIDSSTSLTAAEQELLGSYLDAGGELALFGQDIAYDIKDSNFLADYMKTSFVKDKSGINTITGADFLEGFTGLLNQGDALGQLYPEVVAPLSGGKALFRYAESTRIGGVRVDGAYRLAYFGVGLEGVATAAARKDLLERTIAWLGASSARRKTRRIRALQGLDTPQPSALGRLQAEVLDEARRLGGEDDRAALEKLLEEASESLRQPLLRAFREALYGIR
jgi:carboxypeptidase T